MKILSIPLVVATFITIPSVSTAQSLKERIKQCQTTELDKVIKAKSKAFQSPEYGLTCNPGTRTWRGCNKDNQTRWFEYRPEPGFSIGAGTKFTVTSQTERTWQKNFSASAGIAKIQMHCGGHGCGGQGRVWVKGRISGTLVYQPTANDLKAVADKCLDLLP